MNRIEIENIKFGKGLFYDLDESFKMEGVLSKYNCKDDAEYKYYNKIDGEWYRNFTPYGG